MELTLNNLGNLRTWKTQLLTCRDAGKGPSWYCDLQEVENPPAPVSGGFALLAQEFLQSQREERSHSLTCLHRFEGASDVMEPLYDTYPTLHYQQVPLRKYRKDTAMSQNE